MLLIGVNPEILFAKELAPAPIRQTRQNCRATFRPIREYFLTNFETIEVSFDSPQ